MPQRIRQKGGFTPFSTRYGTINSNCSETSWGASGPNTCYATGEFQSFVDTVTPNFHKLRAEGKVVFNSMSKHESKAFRDTRDYFVRGRNAPINCSGQLRTTFFRDEPNHWENWHRGLAGNGALNDRLPCPIPDLVSGKDLSDLIVECSTRVNSERGRSDFNLWETLAESNKALGTIAGILTSARKIYRRGRYDLLSKEASSMYLAVRYGIMPVVSDINNVISGLEKKVGKVRKTTRSKASYDRYDQRNRQFNNPDFTCFISEQVWDKVEVRAMSLDEHVLTRANALGLSSKGLITLPWELVKRSFVIDWFANIGDFIGSMVPAIGWTNLGSTYTITREKQILLMPGVTTVASGYFLQSPPSGSYTHILKTKSRNVGLASPGIVVKSDFRLTNATRAADALALLVQTVLTQKR